MHRALHQKRRPEGPQSFADGRFRPRAEIFVQPDRSAADAQLATVATNLARRFPEVSRMLYDAQADILAHMAFPAANWRQIRSTNGLERIDVVGIFPSRESVVRLTGSVLMEQDDEWTTSRRYFSVDSMQSLLQPVLPALSRPDCVLDQQPQLPESAA